MLLTYKYIRETPGNFYGTLVEPGSEYQFDGEQGRLAKKSQDFVPITKSMDISNKLVVNNPKKKNKGD